MNYYIFIQYFWSSPYRQTDRQKAAHMSSPCKMHRWAQKLNFWKFAEYAWIILKATSNRQQVKDNNLFNKHMHKFTNARSSDAQFRFWGQRRFKNSSIEIETFFEVLWIWIYNQECPELCITDQDTGSYNTQTRKNCLWIQRVQIYTALKISLDTLMDLEKKKMCQGKLEAMRKKVLQSNSA